MGCPPMTSLRRVQGDLGAIGGSRWRPSGGAQTSRAGCCARAAGRLLGHWLPSRVLGRGARANESSSSSSLPAKVGQRIWFGYAGLLPHGTDLVHITGFRLVGVPDGVRVLSLASARFTAHGYPLAVTDDDLARYFPDLRPGTFVVPAIEVDYQVGWRHGSTVFHYAAELDVAKAS